MTRWQRFWHALGWHFWYEFDVPWEGSKRYGDTYRKCKYCPALEQYIFVPAAPGAFSTWVEVDDD